MRISLSYAQRVIGLGSGSYRLRLLMWVTFIPVEWGVGEMEDVGEAGIIIIQIIDPTDHHPLVQTIQIINLIIKIVMETLYIHNHIHLHRIRIIPHFLQLEVGIPQIIPIRKAQAEREGMAPET